MTMDINIQYNDLLQKYEALHLENERLKQEISALKKRTSEEKENADIREESVVPSHNAQDTKIQNTKKVELFMSLFCGRQDVYARRFVSKSGNPGYAPVCMNEWRAGLCQKPKGKCRACPNKKYAALNDSVIRNHFNGNIIVGIYPLYPDETCSFLAIDFDDARWQDDIRVVREVCSQEGIPIYVERSRSGHGAHGWFFFEERLPAATARRFGSALLTHTMSVRHEVSMESYDRLIPNQDTLPTGGLGNLIALPLQKEARSQQNSVFVDENLQPYGDQWALLSSIQRLKPDDIEAWTRKLSPGQELGMLRSEDEESIKPWGRRISRVDSIDFPQSIQIYRSNMLYIPKTGMSSKGMNHLKRLAAFKNPEFYKKQAMRLDVRKTPRVIDCSGEDDQYIHLPRGCEQYLIQALMDVGVWVDVEDRTHSGRSIQSDFIGSLRDDQPAALDALLAHENGILSGTTAFGKTVVALKLIAERKVNTLILVDGVNLLSQWKKKIGEFLRIQEDEHADGLIAGEMKKKGRPRKPKDLVGQFGAGKDALGGIIDIALIQSLNRGGTVKDLVCNYGMVIIDECHHVSAFSYEQVLKKTNAKYVYGLTATPTRKDGHHPILYMQCGPIRYRDDARKQAEKRPFEHYIVPRFTAFRVPFGKNDKDFTIQEIYSAAADHALRNQQIIQDVIDCHHKGRNSIVLTGRTAHVEMLADALSKQIPNVISLTGGMGAKVTRERLQQVAEVPMTEKITLVATGRFVGEGFDEPRLDTLFLAMPISWKGTVQQYAGRLHRLFDNKQEVQIYDYIDIHVPVLEKMYNRRLYGYASIGYRIKSGIIPQTAAEIIFDGISFLEVFARDILSAVKEIVIVSPYLTKTRTVQMLEYLEDACRNGVRIYIITRPPDTMTDKNKAVHQGVVKMLEQAGVSVSFRANIHQKFAIVDNRVVWYGSINLLSFGKSEESIMRLDNADIAGLLMESIYQQKG